MEDNPRSLMPSLALDAYSQMHIEALAKNSNYHVIREGTYRQIGLSYQPNLQAELHAKRLGHVQKEQARRKHLKEAVQGLRDVIIQQEADDGDCFLPRDASQVQIIERAAELMKILQKKLGDIKLRSEERPY
ncbi:hypothetical protein EYR41_007681 [Orbilia oligospora]|uniref:Uncharacterized protein n=1 Tax=Orbilia oligospora TaxID=2813651 RepID=A0A7C8PBD0_ORBOL|nr:hypothetical protein TWF751_007060 [Orbilia oligospora]TGJ66019.1 hypothetical protein EYR41_007681 [Orbilia oligospora]